MARYYQGVLVRMTCGHNGVIATGYTKFGPGTPERIFETFRKKRKLTCLACRRRMHAEKFLGVKRL